jgi:tetratricopeptide (TPR) repeat protein
VTPLQLRIPELVAGTDIRSLPLSALEGFVLSRIDGRASVLDIVALTGLPQEQVVPILDKLVTLRAVRYTDAVRSQVPGAASQPPKSSPSQAPRPGSDRPSVRGSERPGSSAIPRRRSAHSLPPRRMMGESGFSQSAPDIPPTRMPSKPAAARAPGSRPPSKTPPPGVSRPPASTSGAYRSGASEHTTRVERTTANQPQEPPRSASRPNVPAAPLQPSRPGTVSQRPVDASRNPFEEDPATNVLDRLAEPGPSKAIAPGPPSQPDLLAGFIGEKLPYDPSELLEEVDLPLERRKQVLDLYYRRDEYDYYEVLGVAYEADKKEVRAAYFALSKIFHPDTMFRKNLGSFKAKMEVTFTMLSEAYETLSKKKARDEYDAYLRATKKTQMAERTLRRKEAAAMPQVISVEPPAFGPPTGTGPVLSQPPLAGAPAARSPATVSSARPVPPVVPSQAPPAPPREISDEARRLAQQVMQRRLKGVGAVPPKAQHPAVPPPAPEQTPGRTDPHEIVRRLAKTLKDVGQVTGTNDQLTRYVKASQAAFARGDLAEATQQMRRAVSHAPDRTDLLIEHERLAKMLAEKMAADYEAQAIFEAKNNKWGAAALSWGKVCEGRSHDAGAHRNAAQCMLKAGADLRGAQKYAQQAAFLEPDVVDHRLLLAQIYLTIGLKLNAKRELDAAAKLDPGNEMVKNLLGDLGS